MIKKILSILLVLLILAAPAMAVRTLIGTYNQTYALPYNSASWTSVATGMYVWAGQETQQYFVYNSTAVGRVTAVNVTVKAGPFMQGALGDLVMTLDFNETHVIGPLETSRFKQLNNTILVDFNATAGKIFCIGTP